MKDWVGNKRSTYICNGARNGAKIERETDDYYATDPQAVIELMKYEKFTPKIWECCVGEGHLARELSKNGYEVKTSDIIDRNYPGTEIIDFLKFNEINDIDIITNPPYKFAKEFVEHALDISKNKIKVAMFLKLTFLEGQSRKELFEKYPPKIVYVFSKRIICAKNGEFENIKSGAVAYAWFIFEKGYTGKTIIKWI